MGYREILVSMDTDASAAPRAEFAADVASKFAAQLVGVFARQQIPEPFVPIEAFAVLAKSEVDRIFADHAKAVDSAANAARKILESAAHAQGVATDWRVVPGASELAACARLSDLLVVSAGPGVADPFSAASLVMAGGGPTLIAPPTAKRLHLGRVLVAWNGSREAGRALRAAWPIIARATEVLVLIVSRRGLHEPDNFLEQHFERYGVKPRVILDDAPDAMAGEALRRLVERDSPDLVVMGLYGHTRIRELILGGVSREMLAAPEVPLFVCH